ncbi:MAG: hypothetical protein AB1938_07000 [Myxococcota bacterium]
MRFALLLTAALLASCGANSASDCQTLCEWWHRACFAEPISSCLSDCRESAESAAEGIKRCVEGQGWNSNPSTCQSAGCCVRFVYDDYQARCVG